MKHAVVFVDHRAARIFFPDGTSAEPEERVSSARAPKTADGHRPPLDKDAVHVLCDKVKNAEEILIVGPGTAKNELAAFLQQHHPDVSRRVVGVQAVDHPTPGELKNIARSAFRHIDAFR